MVAGVFALNALGCLIITTLIALRRIARFQPVRSALSSFINR